jgi:hypothetical protein
MATWVSIASDAACAAALAAQQVVVDFGDGVVDTQMLCRSVQAVLQIPEAAAGFARAHARALCTALRAAPPAAEIGTMTDMSVLTVATQIMALTGNVRWTPRPPRP